MSKRERPLEENKRVARILQIVQMIATAPKRYKRKDVAAEFEISAEAIKKDIEVIRHGLRLTLKNERGSGYYFEDIPRLPSLNYTLTEALSLLVAVQAAQQISGVGSPELAAAIARLESLFPTQFRELFPSLKQQPILTAQREHRHEMLTLLNQAMVFRQKVEIVYETRSRGGSIGQRIVHPYQTMPYVRSWQLIAYCEKRDDILMFKIDRIHEATILPETNYLLSNDYDPEEYLGNAWGVMRGVDAEVEEIVLHFDSMAGRWVAEEHWHKSQHVEILEDGSVIFRLHIAITPEFVNWLLYYGGRVEVMEPLHLRQQVAKEHLDAANLYIQTL